MVRKKFIIRRVLFLLLLWNCTPQVAEGSETLDELYANRLIVPLVITASTYPVYADYIEKTLIERLEKNPRFEFSDKGLRIAKSELKKLGVSNLSGSDVAVTEARKKGDKKKEEKKLEVEKVRPLLDVMSEMGVHSVLFSEIKLTPQTFRLQLFLVNARTMELLATTQQDIDDRFTLESFSQATEKAFDSLLKNLPFDGTVVKREGYRVLINRGEPLKEGETIPAFTLEYRRGELSLQETGSIQLTQVGEQISFGKIILEKKPREITQGNKIRIPALHPIADSLAENETDREPASESVYTGPRRSLGYVGLDLGANLVNVASNTSGGAGPSESLFYPGGNLNVELWITRSLFFDIDFQLGLTSFDGSGGASLNSNINGVRGLFGYQLDFDENEVTPVAKVKVGFSRRQFKVDNSSNPNSFVTTTYAGLLIGGAIEVPVSPRIMVGFDVNTLIFNSVSESPLDSGNVLGSSNFDITLKGIFRFNEVVDLLAKIQLAHSSAEFDGTGTRPIAVTSSTQNTRSVFVGLNYYF